MTDAFLHGDAAGRKQAPMAEGLLWYFPDALAAVANVSKRGNDQHNPGQPLHHARGKSTDHADCILRHLAHAGQRDSDGVRETAKVAWRALALLQEEIERDCGVPIPRNAKAQREWEHSTGELKSRDSTAGFTQPPNCSPGVSEPTPPMHAVALDMAEAATGRKRHQPALDMDVNDTVFTLPDNSAYELRPISTCDIGGGLGPLWRAHKEADAAQPEYQTLVGN